MAHQVPPSSSEDSRLRQIIAEYLKNVNAGSTLDREQVLKTYPEYAESLKAFFLPTMMK